MPLQNKQTKLLRRWTVRELAAAYQSCSKCKVAMDLRDSHQETVDFDTQFIIQNVQGLQVRILMVSSVEEQYYLDARPGKLEGFLDELLPLIDPENPGQRVGITFLFASGIERYELHMERDAKELFSGSKKAQLEQILAEMLPTKDFYRVFGAIAGISASKAEGLGQDPDNSLAAIGMICLMFFMLIALTCCLACKRPSAPQAARTSSLSERFQMYNRVDQSPETMKVFIQKTCVICFEDLDTSAFSGAPPQPSHCPDHSPEHTHTEPQDGDIAEAQMEVHVMGDEEVKIFVPPKPIDERAIGDNKGKDTVYLGCRHSFHAQCLREWINNSRSCPVCRAEFEVGRRNPRRTTGLEPALFRELMVGAENHQNFRQLMVQAALDTCGRITLETCLRCILEVCLEFSRGIN